MDHELGLWAWHLEWVYWAVLRDQPGLSIAPLVWQAPVGVIHVLGELLVFELLCHHSGVAELFGHARGF